MQTASINNKIPRIYRVCRTVPVQQQATRNMSLLPRFFANDFAPVFRLMDDYASHVASRTGGSLSSGFSNTLKSFQPRFDIKEDRESYQLQGEFPGLEQKDLEVEFTDAQTLSIKGRTEKHHEEGTHPSAQLEQPAQQDQLTGESETSSYHKASVEDDEATAPILTPAESTPQESNAPASTEPERKADKSRYWLSERSVGQFARTFTFPSRVDHENVKASLKNGILSIVVPKSQAPATKHINVE